MTPEEYQRLKETEKEHLRKIRQLKGMARQAERSRKVTGAVSDMVSSAERLLDEHREMTDRLSHDAALQEARLEIALEAADENASVINQEAEDEAEIARIRARQAMDAQRKMAASAPNSSGGAASADPSNPPPSMPEKTIGRMKR
ncbi:MAG: hypothetical protein RIE53_01175 [Rhodothermales bacterium]